MKQLIRAILVLSALGAPVARTPAGECTQSAEEYVSRLEHWADVRPLDRTAQGAVIEAFHCLAPDRYVTWAGPVAAQHFKNLHESPLRPRLIRACSRYLTLPASYDPYPRDLAFEAAHALALYGVSEVDGYDVLSLLVNRSKANNQSLPYFALASIGDARVLSLLKTTYDSLSATRPSPRIQCDKVELVSCLYHIREDSALAFVRVIAAVDPDSLVRARAKYVISARSR